MHCSKLVVQLLLPPAATLWCQGITIPVAFGVWRIGLGAFPFWEVPLLSRARALNHYVPLRIVRWFQDRVSLSAATTLQIAHTFTLT